jgi:hypothetical protein
MQLAFTPETPLFLDSEWTRILLTEAHLEGAPEFGTPRMSQPMQEVRRLIISARAASGQQALKGRPGMQCAWSGEAGMGSKLGRHAGYKKDLEAYGTFGRQPVWKL